MTITTTDDRLAKAIKIADGAASWLKCRTSEGRKAYGIRSSRDPNHVYLVTRSSCTCQDAARHPGQVCKHRLAVELHVARVGQPASDVVDGLEHMATQRTGLVARRVSEDEIAFERPARTGLDRILSTRRPVYGTTPRERDDDDDDDIFAKFQGD